MVGTYRTRRPAPEMAFANPRRLKKRQNAHHRKQATPQNRRETVGVGKRTDPSDGNQHRNERHCNDQPPTKHRCRSREIPEAVDKIIHHSGKESRIADLQSAACAIEEHICRNRNDTAEHKRPPHPTERHRLNDAVCQQSRMLFVRLALLENQVKRKCGRHKRRYCLLRRRKRRNRAQEHHAHDACPLQRPKRKKQRKERLHESKHIGREDASGQPNRLRQRKEQRTLKHDDAHDPASPHGAEHIGLHYPGEISGKEPRNHCGDNTQRYGTGKLQRRNARIYPELPDHIRHHRLPNNRELACRRTQPCRYRQFIPKFGRQFAVVARKPSQRRNNNTRQARKKPVEQYVAALIHFHYPLRRRRSIRTAPPTRSIKPLDGSGTTVKLVGCQGVP